MIKKLLIVLAFIFISIIVLRFISPEDIWLCQKEEWVKHGNPSTPKPNTLCKIN